MFLDIDLNSKPQKPQLFLCTPNGKIVGKLNESFNINLKLSLRQLNELSFSLPYEIEVNHKLVRNKNIDKIKPRYLVKLQLGNYEEFYIINELNDAMNEDEDVKEVHAFSLGYELRDKLLIDYKVTSYNATQVLTDILNGSIWAIDYIDANFDIMFRSFETSSTTVLDMIYQIAETFNALVIWNTLNRTISFYKPENVGTDKGFQVKYGKYLKSLNKQSNADEMVTRLKVFGKDGLSIQRVNPTGTNYIEDFRYFMYPYEEDINGITIKHSDYMSDGLCKAIINYSNLLETKKGDFDDLLDQKETLLASLTTKQTELYNLQNELKVIEDSLDVAQSTGQSTSQLLEDKRNKESKISAKETEINNINTSISSIDTQINSLQQDISIESNFTSEQIIERNQFIIEKEWSDENYIDDKELYDKAVDLFQEIREPQLVLELNIVNFLEVIEEQLNWDKLQLGDTIYVQYDKLNINIATKIIEIDFDFENAEISLIIANTKDIKDDDNEFLKDFYSVISTSSTVDMNKFKWQAAFDKTNEVATILSNKWDSAKREIVSGVNNSVTINDRGITISNSDNPLKYIRMTNGVIGLTQDGGNSFGVAIDSQGVYAQRLIGQIIAGNQLDIITNSNGSFSVDGNGVTIKGASLTITEGLPENQINSTSVGKWNSAETNAKNYVNQQITEVNTSISQLENDVNNMLSDSKITAIEANTLKTSLNQVVAESTDLINVAGSLGITTEKTNYSNAINDLNTYLTSNWINQASYPKTITSTDRTNIQNKFKTVQDKKSILINKITAVREQNAKNYAVGKGVTYNGVKIDTANGLTVTRSDNKVKTTLNATDGIKIQARTGTSWSNKFYADTEGNLTVKGKIDCDELLIDNTNVLEFIKHSEEEVGKWRIAADRIGDWPDGSYITSYAGDMTIKAHNIRLRSDGDKILLDLNELTTSSNGRAFILDTEKFDISCDYNAKIYGKSSYLYGSTDVEIGKSSGAKIYCGSDITLKNGDVAIDNSLTIDKSLYVKGTAYVKEGYYNEQLATRKWVEDNFVAK